MIIYNLVSEIENDEYRYAYNDDDEIHLNLDEWRID